MAKIGLIRCEKNETRCPLTGCLNSLKNGVEGFCGHDQTELVGVFTCRCPGDGLADLAKILKSKGADTIHSLRKPGGSGVRRLTTAGATRASWGPCRTRMARPA